MSNMPPESNPGALAKLAIEAQALLPKLQRKKCATLEQHDPHNWSHPKQKWKTYHCRGMKHAWRTRKGTYVNR